MTLKRKTLTSVALIEFVLLCVGLAWEPVFISFSFSEYLSYDCPTSIFWEHVTDLVSQTDLRRGTCLRRKQMLDSTHI